MDINKDYYAILGVHQTAEDFVIKVAFKALSKKYHPDSFCGSKEEAHDRMVLINEAYSILSNPEKRKEYDDLRGQETQDAGSFFDEEESFDSSSDPMMDSWKIATSFSPELGALDKKLSRVSKKLSYTFRAFLLESKEFNKASKIASQMESAFMKEYFGTNAEIIDFASYLITRGDKKAARQLNKVVCVFGKGINSDQVITKIRDTYNLSYKTKSERLKDNRFREEMLREERLRSEKRRAELKEKQRWANKPKTCEFCKYYVRSPVVFNMTNYCSFHKHPTTANKTCDNHVYGIGRSRQPGEPL